MKAKELMTPTPKVCTSDDRIVDVARMMRDYDVGSLPVVENSGTNRLIGIITDRDIVVKCLAVGGDPKRTTAGELAQGTPVTVSADTDIRDVMRKMEEHQIRRVPIIDDHRRLVGMISEADLARNLPEKEVGRFVEAVVAHSV